MQNRSWYLWLSNWIMLVHGPKFIQNGDVKPRKEIYIPDYKVYHNLSSIQAQIIKISQLHSSYIQLDNSFRSLHNRPQMVLRVTNFSDSQSHTASHAINIPKVKILLSYGEHAREFLPVESLFHLLNNITQGLSQENIDTYASKFTNFILSKIDLFIVALMNPDGRDYLENKGNYCWRGTSTGVDLNRNFDWQFGNRGSSGNKLDEEYRGPYPFSEPECKVLVDLSSHYQFDAFISMHSGIQQIYVPYADTLSRAMHRKPENVAAMLDLADMMTHAVKSKFTYGLAYQLNDYTADGTIFDFMAGVRKVPFSLAIEMWGSGDHPGAQCFDLFNPKSKDLQRALDDIHPLYEILFDYLVKWKYKRTVTMEDPTENVPSLTFSYILVILILVVMVFVAIQNRLPAWLRLYQRRRIISLRALSSTFTIFGAFRL